MPNNQSENENENTAGREQIVSENPVEVGGAAEMAAMMKEMQEQMRILQEKVDNGRTLSGPCPGEVRPPLSGPRPGDEREENSCPWLERKGKCEVRTYTMLRKQTKIWLRPVRMASMI